MNLMTMFRTCFDKILNEHVLRKQREKGIKLEHAWICHAFNLYNINSLFKFKLYYIYLFRLIGCINIEQGSQQHMGNN